LQVPEAKGTWKVRRGATLLGGGEEPFSCRTPAARLETPVCSHLGTRAEVSRETSVTGGGQVERGQGAVLPLKMTPEEWKAAKRRPKGAGETRRRRRKKREARRTETARQRKQGVAASQESLKGTSGRVGPLLALLTR
jgi:hypothetical protein